MIHNSLYRLSRSQKLCLNSLGVLFLVLSFVWFVFELIEVDFPMEPCVVFVGGSATLLASYWPWKPTYKNKRTHGRNLFDYQNTNDGIFDIGCGACSFALKFTKGDASVIHMYNDPDNIEAIALTDAKYINDVKDIAAVNFGNRVVSPFEGGIVALRNIHGNYALVHIHDIRDVKSGDDRDEVTFSFAINPDGKTDFS